MKDHETRHAILSFRWGFECTCTICTEETHKNDNGKYEKFAELEAEVQCLQREIFTLDNIRRQIDCIKEMYKIAQDKKPGRSLLITLLEDGLFAAMFGTRDLHFLCLHSSIENYIIFFGEKKMMQSTKKMKYF